MESFKSFKDSHWPLPKLWKHRNPIHLKVICGSCQIDQIQMEEMFIRPSFMLDIQSGCCSIFVLKIPQIMFPGKWVRVQTWTDNICSAEVQEKELDLKGCLIFNLVKFNQSFSPRLTLWPFFHPFKDNSQIVLVSLDPLCWLFMLNFHHTLSRQLLLTGPV